MIAPTSYEYKKTARGDGRSFYPVQARGGQDRMEEAIAIDAVKPDTGIIAEPTSFDNLWKVK